MSNQQLYISNPLASKEHRKAYADQIVNSLYDEVQIRKLCQALTIFLRNPNHVGPLRKFLGRV